MLKNISIRRANRLDTVDIFKWRNHPKVKRGAFCRKDLDLKIHYSWMEDQIKNGTLFIAHLDNKPLGVVCFYKQNDEDNSYIWSFYLVPEQQHKALGLTLMDAGMLIARNVLGAKKVWAETSPDNLRSIQLHQKLGFKMMANEWPEKYVFVKEVE